MAHLKILFKSTGINVIDNAINDLYNKWATYTITSECTLQVLFVILANAIGIFPLNGFYYHLIDGDWGSNALSWQMVCGSNSSKIYC